MNNIAPSRIADFYSLVAPFYDALVGPFLRMVRKDICRIAKDLKCRRILDVACGTGEQVIMLSRAGMEAAGIDLSQAMLREAHRKSPPGILFLQGDAANLPFGAGSFDCATISLALHEMGPQTGMKVLEQMLGVLSSDGKLIVFDYSLTNGFGSGLSLGLLGMVERFAGRRHFRNFVRFVGAGAVERCLEPFALRTIACRKYFLGSLGLYIMEHSG
jgi:demethylmenaquinone methyltransferase/2-methoxy-6-polyprenyl-1,4-benzoquinol methylase